MLQLDRGAVDQLVADGELVSSALHDVTRVTVASLETRVDARIAAGEQSLLARWGLGQIVTRCLKVPRAGSTAERASALLDAVALPPLSDSEGTVV